ncbi:DUF4167 domain-containing protein [Ensifer adhaerens]|jgi:hypothetical protein|uniref:DUF4167 domain-containing protein n=1 Tax=Ensifer adhaerens TaxID=106592 RepID=A0A9Q8Y782_ENSAD|nr:MULTISPECIES: DUF4167 domain-containing protein [Ensifer]KSV63930.1 hypothetical protein N185_35610 [Sinorhizobium sp. GW3]OWZ92216.1 hypothetical protein B9J07_17195 [Sinorhizobium sp. LM21]ANK73553.1 hypothetical protein FA04_13575 [Ensifer adhaerens]KDP73579.1 hypothetical protein FA04_10755 [Ensifer adhaerens]KQX27154.1 hypothetical protein ASD01_23340 [Ensifer sp. Root423]
MRPGQQNKRGRGRNNNNNNNNNGSNNNHNRKGSNPLTRTYDSSGPDVKIRGTAQHIAEKYSALARDAQSSGDRVMAENYLQHAEHYNRIIAAAQAQMQDRFQRDDRQDFRGHDAADQDQDDLDQGYADDMPASGAAAVTPVAEPQPVVIDGTGPQPVIEGTPAEVAMEEEAPAASGRAATRRRNAPRPRRPRRSAQEGAADEAQPSGDDAPEAPALAASE